ncbi:hypothetical protein JG688_00017107 [Phytophthora aleatoria]|uniref:Uncharacterized protein n=1 Tax=Phytophthora aleatoria TaxID=2496075 RepID=A0A8J5IXH6_9STRA|nr:hypothetical protein JG688_00017107 [Phytophthora aleatoria]
MAETGRQDIKEPDTVNYCMTPCELIDNSSSYPGLRSRFSGPRGVAKRRPPPSRCSFTSCPWCCGSTLLPALTSIIGRYCQSE